MNKLKLLLFFILSFTTFMLFANTPVTVSKNEFIDQMNRQHGFAKPALTALFDELIVSETILNAISRPAEKKLSWYKYRNIFIQDKRIKQGVDFWKKNKQTLLAAEKKFGVPLEIIVAIIGVETFYGKITGSYRVVDALNTLAFHYPKRADFFRGEFEQFLLLAREQGLDPRTLKGSYAGAMGMPQFISSSYRHYAIDFDGDEFIDIWNNPKDAIGSVANYFSAHGWQSGKPVADRVQVRGDKYKQFLDSSLEPKLSVADIKYAGIISNKIFESDEKLKLFEFDLENSNEYWLTHENFYVITRYNHSALYAMAVFQLANAIKAGIETK